MYKAKHGLILESKYLMLVYEGDLIRVGEEEEKRRKRREGEEEEEEKRRIREVQEKSKIWITIGLYGFLWLGMTMSCYKPRF